jgi:HprK-related kinase B
MNVNDITTAKAFFASLADRATTKERLDVVFADCHIEVVSNSRRLLEKLAYYFKDFVQSPVTKPQMRVVAIEAPAPSWNLQYIVKQPDPGKTKIKEEYVDFADGRLVHKRLTGMVFLFGNGRHLAYGPCVENDNQVVNFINNRFIQHSLDHGYLLGHAAGVDLDGRGLALAGLSGRGKSTLALEIMRLGTRFVSNDRLMVRRHDASLSMLGVAKLPRINPGTILANEALATVMPDEDREQAAKLSGDDLWKLEQKYDAFIDQCFGPGRFVLSSAMTGLVVLTWEREGGPLRVVEATLAKRRDLLGAFMKSVGLFYEDEPSAPAADFTESAYLEVLGDCPVFEFTGGVDFKAGAAACLRFLESGEMTRDESS